VEVDGHFQQQLYSEIDYVEAIKILICYYLLSSSLIVISQTMVVKVEIKIKHFRIQ